MDHPPEAHPAFSKHFTDSLYDDLEGEFTPFDTDEAYDLLAEWSWRRDELRTGALEDILGEDELYEALGEGDVDAATIDTGAAPRCCVCLARSTRAAATPLARPELHNWL